MDCLYVRQYPIPSGNVKSNLAQISIGLIQDRNIVNNLEIIFFFGKLRKLVTSRNQGTQIQDAKR